MNWESIQKFLIQENVISEKNKSVKFFLGKLLAFFLLEPKSISTRT